MCVNLIIIGAKRFDIEISNDYMEWNNPNQASYYILKQLLLEIKNIKIFCLDGDYPKNITNINIQFIKEYYKPTDTKYFDINSHNIIIDFCNLLDENWCSSTTNYNIYDNKYNMTFIACGCCWNNNFPIDILKTVIEYKLYTPTDPMNISSYLTSINYSQQFQNIEYMKPFHKGIYQILGTLMFRGYKDNYKLEEPLRELFKINSDFEILLNNSQIIEFNLFLNKNIHWNQLSRIIRLLITKYIYSIDI